MLLAAPVRQVTLSLRDALDAPARVSLHTRPGFSFGAYLAAPAALAGLLAPLTLARVHQVSWSVRVTRLDTPRPPSTSDAQRAAVFVFETAQPDDYLTVLVPSPRPELVLTEGPDAGRGIDTTHPAVVALVAAVLAAPWCAPSGEPATALLSAALAVRS